MNSCEVCLDPCTNVTCSCLCSCVGLEYSNCLDLNEKLNENQDGSEKDSTYSDVCLKACSNDHYSCKICHTYKCCCLGNVLNLNHRTCSTSIKNFSKHNKVNDLINCSNKQAKRPIDNKQETFKMKQTYSDQLYFELDYNFKQLFNYFLSDEYSIDQSLFKLRRNFEVSLDKVRSLGHEKFNDQKKIEQLCFKLDQKLNRSLRKYPEKCNQDHQIDEFNLSKFDLFVYLSLLHRNEILKKIEAVYPESIHKIKSLIIFIDKKRYPVDQLLKPALKHCLNQVDSLQLNTDLKVRKLFPFRLNDLSFKFLTFLILDLHDDLFEPVQLQLNNLIALKHLEIYGSRFKFRKSRSFNANLLTLIVHDKLVRNLCILELFPNLVIVKIPNSSGDILKPNPVQNYFKDTAYQTELRVISLLNLSFNDFIFIINHCKKIEYLECNLIYNQIPSGLKFLPNLKFVNFSLKLEQYKMGKTLTELIYFNLTDLNSDALFFSNKFYCPKQFGLLDDPCFKTNCMNCQDNYQYRLPKKRISKCSAFKDTYQKLKALDFIDFVSCNYEKIKMNVSKNKHLKKMSKSLNDLSNLGKPVIRNLEKINKFVTRSRTNLDEIEKLNECNEKIKTDYYNFYKSSRIRNANKHIMIYLNGVRLYEPNLGMFNKVACKLSYLKISELNRLVSLLDLEIIKEKLYNCKTIELDESIDDKLISTKLSTLISDAVSLVVSKVDYFTLDYLIEQMRFIRTIELKEIRIDKKMSDYMEVKMRNVFKQLESFEHHCKGDKMDETVTKCLLNCNSLNKLKLKNVFINNNDLFRILVRNIYCSHLELSYPSTKLDQRKLIEVLSFNALINKNLNYKIKFERNRILDFNDLLPNLIIEG